MRGVVYNPITGEIEAAVLIGGPEQRRMFSEYLLELDDEDFESGPYLWAEIDVQRKTIHPKAGKIDPTSKQRKPKI